MQKFENVDKNPYINVTYVKDWVLVNDMWKYRSFNYCVNSKYYCSLFCVILVNF